MNKKVLAGVVGLALAATTGCGPKPLEDAAEAKVIREGQELLLGPDGLYPSGRDSETGEYLAIDSTGEQAITVRTPLSVGQDIWACGDASGCAPVEGKPFNCSDHECYCHGLVGCGALLISGNCGGWGSAPAGLFCGCSPVPCGVDPD